MAADQELTAMASVLSVMEALDAEARARVLAWVAQKLAINESLLRMSSPTSKGDSQAKFDHSTDTIATLIKAGSGPDLIIAAAAHLHFAEAKAKFSRQDLTAQMRTAPGHFKETFVNNLSKYLSGLTKADRLRLVAKDTYALSSKERQDLEVKIADA